MNIATRTDADLTSLDRIPFGRVFWYGGDLYERTNPAVHLDAQYGWATKLVDGLLTKFGPLALVRSVEGEFIPK